MAGEELRDHLRRSYTNGVASPLNYKLHGKMMGRYGNYPLATRDRMDEFRKEEAARASMLKEKFGDKWPLDPVHGSRPPLGQVKVKKLWRRALIYAKAVAAMKTKPPKQQTRVELDKLLQIALATTRKKIYYEWDMILGAFHIDAEKEKKRQRRLMMNLGKPNLTAPGGKDIRLSALCYTLRSEEGPRCTFVEVVKLFAHQLAPLMEEVPDNSLDESAAQCIVDYCESEDKVPLSKLQDPEIGYQMFYDAVYPGDDERAEWDDQLAEKVRLEREEQQKDERARKVRSSTFPRHFPPRSYFL